MGVGAGIESMSLYDMQASLDPSVLSEKIFEIETARNCLIPMGMTADTIGQMHKLTRTELDQFAVNSHLKAAKAVKEGKFDSEIVPVKTFTLDKDGKKTDIVVTKDFGIRENSTVAGLAKLKSAFTKGGLTTAANSSQMTDGAGACLLARRSVAEKHGLPILAKFVSYSVVGVPPELMGNYY